MSHAPSNNRREQVRARNERNAFRRSKEAFAQVEAARRLSPIEQMMAMAAIKYRSRGKGRGTPSRRYGNTSSHWSPNGEQEKLRRVLGGWARCKAMHGTTKRQYLTRELEI